MEYPRKLLFLGTAFLLALNSAKAVANVNPFASPWFPRFGADGFAGTASHGTLDVMLPIIGNSANVVYANALGKYGNDTASLVSLGAGFRHVINNSQLWGAYIFADKNVSDEGKTFWYISPGIETLGTTWDFRVNGYIPNGPKNKFIRRLFADDLGNPNFVTFHGHQQFDHQVDLFEVVGPGLDAEVGRSIPRTNNNLRVYLGGYYFQPQQEDSVKGLEARLEYCLNAQVGFNIRDTYDNNSHNTIGVGVRLTLGGMRDSFSTYCIQSRMMDRVQKNLGSLSTGAGVPIVKHKQDTGEVLVRDNIWFFDDTSGTLTGEGIAERSLATATEVRRQTPATIDSSQGTFENPFHAEDFNQNTLDGINQIAPNANLYFSPGRYTAVNGVDPITIDAGQALFGRTADFKEAAAGNLRANFLGGFISQGQNSFDSIILIKGSHNFANGFTIEDTEQVLLSNVEIGLAQFNLNENFTTGIFINNSENIVIDHTTVNVFRTDVSPVAISAINSELNVKQSVINAQLQTTNSGNLAAFSIFQSTVNVQDTSIISSLHINGDNSFVRSNHALDITEGSTVIIANSHISSNTAIDGNNNDFNNATAISLQSSDLTMSNTTVEANALTKENNFSTNQGVALLITEGITPVNSSLISENNNFKATAIINGDNHATMSNDSFGIFQDFTANVSSSHDMFDITSQVDGTSDLNTATGIMLSQNADASTFVVNNSTITTHAIIGINDSLVGGNEAQGFAVESSDTNVTLQNTNIDSNAIVLIDNPGLGINLSRGFFLDTSVATNYDINIIDSAIRTFAAIPVTSSSLFNTATAITPLNDPNVTVINTAISQITES